jgi:uncharacterized protein (TIGR00730 family)
MRVTVFGGSSPKPGQPAYEQAQMLGHLLGQAGHTVLTGGYIGTMEAVSRGAAEAGAHVIGVTCSEIENWRPVHPNRWVIEEQRFATLHERLHALMTGCDAAIALPGGPGTLAEIAYTWNHLIIDAISPRPLILVGRAWQETIRFFLTSMDGYVSLKDQGWVQFAADEIQAVSMLSAIPGDAGSK